MCSLHVRLAVVYTSCLLCCVPCRVLCVLCGRVRWSCCFDFKCGSVKAGSGGFLEGRRNFSWPRGQIPGRRANWRYRRRCATRLVDQTSTKGNGREPAPPATQALMAPLRRLRRCEGITQARLQQALPHPVGDARPPKSLSQLPLLLLPVLPTLAGGARGLPSAAATG